jgi:hypothetical protein
VTFLPPPPNQLELCIRPGAALEAESADAAHMFYSGKRVHIVGGQPTDRVIRAVTELAGLAPSDVTWLPSEKGKPPRDLKKKWANLRADRDITVCVTGRIGHAQSEAAAKAADGCGVVHIRVESANELIGRLKELVRT